MLLGADDLDARALGDVVDEIRPHRVLEQICRAADEHQRARRRVADEPDLDVGRLRVRAVEVQIRVELHGLAGQLAHDVGAGAEVGRGQDPEVEVREEARDRPREVEAQVAAVDDVDRRVALLEPALEQAARVLRDHRRERPRDVRGGHRRAVGEPRVIAQGDVPGLVIDAIDRAREIEPRFPRRRIDRGEARVDELRELGVVVRERVARIGRVHRRVDHDDDGVVGRVPVRA